MSRVGSRGFQNEFFTSYCLSEGIRDCIFVIRSNGAVGLEINGFPVNGDVCLLYGEALVEADFVERLGLCMEALR